jgi:signal transduction histidine kinase
MLADRSFNEQTRAHAVRDAGILDTPPESSFDDLVRIAAATFDVPIAAINFIDSDRQWLKAKVGISRTSLPRHAGFCPLVVATREVLVVPDTARAADWVTWTAGLGAGIRFYAGAPLVSGGHALGTLCVADRRPRSLGADARETLRALARSVVAVLEARRLRERLARTVEERRRAIDAAAIAQSTLSHSREAIALFDLEGRFVGQNDVHRRLLGFDDRELEAIGCGTLAGEAARTIAEALTRTGAYQGDVRYRTADGGSLDVELGVFPVKDAAGRIAGHCSLVRERSGGAPPATPAEPSAARPPDELPGTIEALCAELDERDRTIAELGRDHAREVQRERLKAIGEVTGSISHQINDVLTIVIGHASTLDLTLPAGDSRRDDLTAIVDAAERGSVLTRQLLAFTRQHRMTLEPLDVAAVITARSGTLRRLLGREVDLVLDLDPDVGEILGDRALVEQAVLNLALNARNAMPRGGSFTIESALVAVDDLSPAPWRGLRHGLYVQLRISDTGLGMPPEVAARAFEPFFTTNHEQLGAGLGLSTVHGIVTQGGGHVQLASDPGRGTTVTILLPRVCASTGGPGPSTDGAVTRGGS